jgi:hypothetical protein
MDSGLVVKFLENFNRLKEYCSGNPDNISEIAEKNDECHTLCVTLYSIASDLRTAEFATARAFSSPTNPIFVKAWREWLLRFEEAVADIAIKQAFLEDREVSVPQHLKDELELSWDLAQIQGISILLSIETLLIASQVFPQVAEKMIRQVYGEDMHEPGEISAFEAWKNLKEKVGLDPLAAARRRILTPFVLVPRKVSDKVSISHSASLLNLLADAQRAFIFGANNAAVALLRSIMENVLREHYNAEGGRLDELIGSVWNRLPANVHVNKLDRIRRLANSILHHDSFRRDPWSHLNERELEEEMVEMFKMISSLIEGVK